MLFTEFRWCVCKFSLYCSSNISVWEKSFIIYIFLKSNPNFETLKCLHNSFLILNPITSETSHVTPFWGNRCKQTSPGVASRISFLKRHFSWPVSWLCCPFPFFILFPPLFHWNEDKMPWDAAQSCSPEEKNLTGSVAELATKGTSLQLMLRLLFILSSDTSKVLLF